MKNLEHEIRDLLNGKEQLDEFRKTKGNDNIISDNALDLASLIPGVGSFASAEATRRSLNKGNYLDAGLSALGMIPGAGTVTNTLKLAVKKGLRNLTGKGVKDNLPNLFKKSPTTVPTKPAKNPLPWEPGGVPAPWIPKPTAPAAPPTTKPAPPAPAPAAPAKVSRRAERVAQRSIIKTVGKKWGRRLGLLGLAGLAGAGLKDLIRNMGVYGGTGDSGGAIQTPGTATQLHHIAAETEYNLPLIEAVEPLNETRKNYNAATKKRKEIENVARPTKNKLTRLKRQMSMSKQGEIQTKIIDESAPGNIGSDIPLHDIYTGMKHTTGTKADFKHDPDTGRIRIFKRGVPERTWSGFFKGEKTPKTPHLDFESEEHAKKAGWKPYDEAFEPLNETRKRFRLENIKKKIIDDEFNIRNEFNNFLIEENIELTEEEYDEAFDILFQYFVQDLNENIGSNLYKGAEKTLRFVGRRVLAPALYASDAYEKYKKGDTSGALTSGAKAVASVTPIGAAASLAHDAYEARKDIADVAKRGYDYARKSLFGKPKSSNQISQNSGLQATSVT